MHLEVYENIPIIFLSTSFLIRFPFLTMKSNLGSKQQHRPVYFEKELCKAMDQHLVLCSGFDVYRVGHRVDM